MTPPRLTAEELRASVQATLDAFLSEQAAFLAEVSEDLGPLTAWLARLMDGGKRLRPAFCAWAYLGVGGQDVEAGLRAAASLELLQACALVHDDVMDGSDLRRGIPAAHRRFATMHRGAGWLGDPDRFGTGAAILLGDLCLSWSDELLYRSGLPRRRSDRPSRSTTSCARSSWPASTWTCSSRRRRAPRSTVSCVWCATSRPSTRSSGHCTWARCWPAPRQRLLDGALGLRAAARRGLPAARRRPGRLRRSGGHAASPRATTCGRASGRCSWPWRCSGPPPSRPRSCARASATRTWRAEAIAELRGDHRDDRCAGRGRGRHRRCAPNGR